MGETAQILALWHRALAHGERVCLATVVHVEGSSYRKPGARMLLTAGGERAGTISGGCLEAEVSRKAWWLTANGPTVQAYQSSFDEDGGGAAWGLGCGGTVWVLLEQQPDAVLRALEALISLGTPAVVVTQLQPPAGTLGVLTQAAADIDSAWSTAAHDAFREQRTIALDQNLVELSLPVDGLPPFLIEYLAAPPRLTIFGAGDDAQPIARFAETLGWRVAVADGRSHLLRRERFPESTELRLLSYPPAEPGIHAQLSAVVCGLDTAAPAATAGALAAFPAVAAGAVAQAAAAVDPGVAPGELAVILTHSFEQDRALLAALLPLPLTYLGILGPRHRTLRLLEEVAPALGWTEQQCLARLHSPVGLDLGARDPAAIALSIVADLQAVLAGRRVDVRRTHPGSAPAAPVRTDRHG